MREMWENEGGLHSKRGQTAVRRINAIHANYGDSIKNVDMLFTLGGFMLEPGRVMERFAIRSPLPNEMEAAYLIWKGIGEAMGIQNIPGDLETANAVYDTFEAREQKWSANGQVLTESAMQMMVEELPQILRPIGIMAICSLLDAELRNALKLPAPNVYVQTFVLGAMDFRSFFLRNFVYPLPETQPKRGTPTHLSAQGGASFCPMQKMLPKGSEDYVLERLGSAPQGVLATTLPKYQ